jgi:transcriptional regulator with XRE-family HTH domain
MAYENALKSLGLRIKTERKKHSLSQEEVAAKLNVSSITISRWETGKQSPDYVTLCRIAEIFDVPLSLLIAQEDQSNVNGDMVILISGRTRKKSNLVADFEFVLRDIGRLNPDLLVMIYETEQAWDALEDREKQIVADGLSFVFGSFNAALARKKPYKTNEMALRHSGTSGLVNHPTENSASSA